jgi:hypothetical protein
MDQSLFPHHLPYMDEGDVKVLLIIIECDQALSVKIRFRRAACFDHRHIHLISSLIGDLIFA